MKIKLVFHVYCSVCGDNSIWKKCFIYLLIYLLNSWISTPVFKTVRITVLVFKKKNALIVNVIKNNFRKKYCALNQIRQWKRPNILFK